MSWLSAIELRQPWFLLCALLALPVYFWALRGGGRVVFSSLRLLPAATKTWRTRLRFVPPLCLALATAALALSLAGPRVADRQTRVKKQGIAIMLVIDVSGSMQALDLSTPDRERTRLDAVRDVLLDFVLGGHGLPGRPDDLLGIVSFAAYADTRCPLTLDHANLAKSAKQVEIVSKEDEDGTAIGDGLGLALERLRESKATSRVAILLTDGVNNRGETAPLQAADLAATLGIKVYTVGAGTNGMAPVRVTDAFGRRFLSRMPVEIDEKMLRAIAEKTGGRYFRATDDKTLSQVYREIDALERSEFIEQRYRQYHEYYPLALAVGLLLAAAAWLLQATLLRRVPQ
ncbi:MAG: VWA domain-containing protein [Myxococcales bacterium]|nr:VWA domain-containing protein [Myxococcales bacterium]